MGKAGNLRKKSLNLLVGFQRRMIIVKKSLRAFFKNSRPYLAPKYWLIYLTAFGLGFYLWGPARGIAKLQNWELFKEDQTDQIKAIEALQREIDLLKKELEGKRPAAPENLGDFNPDSFGLPALGEIVQGFEWINDRNTWRLHTGIDIGMAPGGNIMAVAPGVVKEVTEAHGAGFKIIIEHGNGWESVYANLGEAAVEEGERVLKGAIIGTSGEKTCHSAKSGFHFGINHNQQPINPGKIIKGLIK